RLAAPAGALAARALARQPQVAPGRQAHEPSCQESADPAGYERPHAGFLRAGVGLRPVQLVSPRNTAFASGPWLGVGQTGGPYPTRVSRFRSPRMGLREVRPTADVSR